MSQRRRRRRENKKPLSKKSIATAVVGGLSLVLFAVLIEQSFTAGGKVSRMLTGAAVLALLLTLLALVESVRALRNSDTSFISRLVGLLVPLVAEAAWITLYVVGCM
ncbi:MAG: hypothetical protein IIU28_01980 [Lachnospiraceae bacterium]|nr:hypothetical protein [Lachnospiraceae bacterium]